LQEEVALRVTKKTEGVEAESAQSDEEQVEQGGEEDGEAHFEAAD
jgi:hypothetical protein